MRCINCGEQTSPAQNFCRSCGGKLAPTSDATRESLAAASSARPAAKATSRMIARRMNRALLRGLNIIGRGVTLLANGRGHVLIDWLGIPAF